MVDRRAHERVVHQRRLTLTGPSGTFDGWSEDLSEGGLLAVTDHDVPLGTRLQLRLHLKRGSLSVPIVVLRLTSVDGRPAFGARFVEPSPHARAVLRREVAEAAMRKALGDVRTAPRPRVRSQVQVRAASSDPPGDEGSATG